MLRNFLALTLPVGLVTIAASAAIADPSRNFFVTGPDAITYSVAQLFGGVVLQGRAEFQTQTQQHITTDQLKLRLASSSDKQVCIEHQGVCYTVEIAAKPAIHLAKLSLTGRTGIFSDKNPGEGYDHVMGGYAPPELNQDSILAALNEIDYGLLWNKSEGSELKDFYNARNGFSSSFKPDPSEIPEEESYINADTDTDLIAVLDDNQVKMNTSVTRFSWAKFPEHNEMYITDVEEACDPKDIKAYNTQRCSGMNFFGYVFDPYSDEFKSGEYIVPYMVVGASTTNILSDEEGQQITNAKNILLSLPEANAQRFKYFAWNNEQTKAFTHVEWVMEEDGKLLTNWEDTIGGGDGDFNDMKVSISASTSPFLWYEGATTESSETLKTLLVPVSESTGVFQINGPVEESIYLNFDVLAKNSAHSISEFGFFKVDDPYGSINGLKPSDPGYLDAALESDRHHIVISYDAIVEDIEEYYPRQKEAIDLVRATAVFRSFADNNPQELRKFIREASR